MIQNNIFSSRDTSLDAVCGLFIIWMIIGHAFQWSATTDDSFYIYGNDVLFMFMPWFFFKSGMYYRQQTNTKAAIIKWSKKLLVPYIVYTIIGELVLWAMLYQQGTLNWRNIVLDPAIGIVFEGSAGGNLALWFLLTLFLVKSIVTLADKYKIKKVYLFAVSVILGGGGTILIQHVAHTPYWLINTPLGILFYLTGYYLKDKQYDRRTLIVSIIIFSLILAFIPSQIGFRNDRTICGYWVLGVIGSLAGIVIFNNLFKLRPFQLPVLTSIGRNSMDYYCAHWILFYLVCLILGFDNRNGLPNYDEFWKLLIASIIVLPSYSYWISLKQNLRLGKVVN